MVYTVGPISIITGQMPHIFNIYFNMVSCTVGLISMVTGQLLVKDLCYHGNLYSGSCDKQIH